MTIEELNTVAEMHETTVDEMLEYLDVLRESGATNMWGATIWIQKEFNIESPKQARDLLGYWMTTFSERHA